MKILRSELRSIQKKISGLLAQVVGRLNTRVVTVPISQCRHYCAFKYECRSFNPYENYTIGLHEGVALVKLRQQFEDFLIYFRPRNFGEVFDIEMSRHIPLWVYPWHYGRNFNPNAGWLNNLSEVPDIITHFCERGIKRSRIEEEYFWLKRAYTTISTHGYQPHNNSFIEAIELNKKNKKVYILTDGNHRVSALAALGYKEVVIKVLQSVQWNDENHRKWPQIRSSMYTEQDAIRLFNVYFTGVDGFKRSDQPAEIIEE